MASSSTTRHLALALALAAAACAPAPPAATTTPTPTPSKRATSAPGRPVTPASSEAPGASAAPGTSPTAAAGSAAPASPGAPAATPDPRLARIEQQLLRVALVDFGQNRGRLASDGAFDGDGAALIGDKGAGIISNNGSGLISDQGGSIVSNNGGRIVSNNGGSILSNNGGSVVSNNGGSVVSNNGGNYALAQAASPAPSVAPPKVVIVDAAQADEKLVGDRLYADGVRFHTYAITVPSGLAASRRVASRAGKAFLERRTEVLATYASGRAKTYREDHAELLAGGRFAFRKASVTELDEAGVTTASAVQPGAFVVDDATGGVTYIDEFAYEVAGRTGSFRYRYAAFGLEERGTLQDLEIGASGGVRFAFWDPLEVDDGESRVLDPGGQLLFTKRRRTVGGEVHREYDLGEGLTMALVRKAADRSEGRLSEGGRETAGVVQETRADGSAVFVVTFDDRPDRPLTIGYGMTGGQPAARPSQPPRWSVVTAAGGGERGHANGAGAAARFDRPIAVAAARATTGKLFVADTGNHRIRALIANGAVEAVDVAGGTEAAYVDGAAATARFKSPYGLAVGADDALYVSDLDDHRIRVVAPDGTVSTLAGTGSPGFADGPAGVGTLYAPTGLALDGQGRLWVAEYGNHAIRRIETAGPDRGRITTIAGGGPTGAGFADGPAATARFAAPRGLAFGPDGALYVADHDNRRIRRVAADGTTTTFAGSADASRLYFDGPATATYLNPPRALAFAPDGTLYFTTPFDVFAVTPAGELRSYAGMATKGQTDGIAAFASFVDAHGLHVGASGTVYVLDGDKVRAILAPKP